jgi:hypothetical protein
MAVKQIMERFVNSVDVNNNYTTVELIKLLKEAAKNNKSKSTDASGEPRVKKPPSAYNLFIKEQMELLKTDGCSPKDRMRKATEKWKEAKEAKEKKAADPKTEESVAE